MPCDVEARYASQSRKGHDMKPITIEVTRGGIVESRHHVSLSVVDGAGRDVIAH